MLLALPGSWLEGAPSSVDTTLVHFTRLLHVGWLLFIRWVNIYWTLVMAICPVPNKAVTSGQLLGTLSSTTFLEGIFRSILYPPSHFH